MDNTTNISTSAEPELSLMLHQFSIPYFVYALFSFILNGLTFGIIAYHHGSLDKHSAIISSLNLSDAIHGFFEISYLGVLGIFPKDKFAARILHSIAMNFGLSSQWHTVTLSGERLYAVQYRLSFPRHTTPFKRRLVLSFPFLVALLSLIGMLIAVFVYSDTFEQVERNVQFSNIMTTVIINLSIYLAIWGVAVEQKHRLRRDHNHAVPPKVFSNSTISVILIVLVNLILWMPYMVNTMTSTYDDLVEPIWHLNTIVHCVVYFALNKMFRHKVLQLCFHPCRPSREPSVQDWSLCETMTTHGVSNMSVWTNRATPLSIPTTSSAPTQLSIPVYTKKKYEVSPTPDDDSKDT